MDPKQKEYLWISIIIGFYLLTSLLGVYDINLIALWPIFAIPMSLGIIRTGQKKKISIIGLMLSIIISIITTGTLQQSIISAFLLLILIPSFIFGTLYIEEEKISRIIVIVTITLFLNIIVFLILAKFAGIDYLNLYYDKLDEMQKTWNSLFNQGYMNDILPNTDNDKRVYAREMGRMILQAKRTYPAMLFVMSLMTSITHTLLIQLVGRISSWPRPRLRDVLEVRLSGAAALIFIGLWMVISRVGDVDSTLVFAAENMVSVMFVLFQLLGLLAIISLIMQLSVKRIFRVLLVVIGVLWLIVNPLLLAVFGFLDSIFNFRKVDTLI